MYRKWATRPQKRPAVSSREDYGCSLGGGQFPWLRWLRDNSPLGLRYSLQRFFSFFSASASRVFFMTRIACSIS